LDRRRNLNNYRGAKHRAKKKETKGENGKQANNDSSKIDEDNTVDNIDNKTNDNCNVTHKLLERRMSWKLSRAV